jgi:hypothetical protein
VAHALPTAASIDLHHLYTAEGLIEMTHDTTGAGMPNDAPADCDGRTHRACTETMIIQPLLDGRYKVHSQSGRTYITDPTNSTCDCPDPCHDAGELGCKHLRRVKLEIACGELPHPDNCPTDAELAAREPSRGLAPPHLSPPTTAVADGGHAVDSTPSNATTPAAAGICRAISDRIRDLEREIDCYQAELHDLQTALSVIEDISEYSRPPGPPTAATALADAAANGDDN